MSDLEFEKKVIKELHIWTWMAILLPGLIVFGSVILWTLGLTSESELFIIISVTIILGLTILWWWWAISIIRDVLRLWSTTQEDIRELIADVKNVRDLIEQVEVRAELVSKELNKNNDNGDMHE